MPVAATQRKRPPSASAADILQALQLRICLAGPEAEWLLHEGKLGLEFGVSRTPVRQVLQRLAFERLVETRSGVGTVVAPLNPTLRGRDMAMLRGVLRLARDCAAPTLSLAMRADFAGLGVLAEAAGAPDAEPEAYFHWRARILAMTSTLIADPILAEAHDAMHWRAIRWRMAEPQRGGPAALFERLSAARTAVDVLDAVGAELDSA